MRVYTWQCVCVCRLQPLYAADPREHPLLSPDERRTPGHEGMCENMNLQFQLGNFFELAVECFAVCALTLFVGRPVKTEWLGAGSGVARNFRQGCVNL